MSESAIPRCPHFGACGGCQYQDHTYADQLDLKRTKLAELLHDAGINEDEIVIHASEPYEYRNRIRLRIERVDGALHFGYNRADSNAFLPIITCPIAAPILWSSAQSLLSHVTDFNTAACLQAAAQVELFCNDDLSRVQMTLLYAPRTAPPRGSFDNMMQALQTSAPHITSAAAVSYDPRTGMLGRTLASFEATGLAYRVNAETYWISRGGFFQVNRFLVGKLVELVTAGRSGALAWDLFAGVGLFSRILAKSFREIIAVEANPSAAQDLRAALSKLGRQHTAAEATTLGFLQQAVTQRERPDLIVLDPPRAGAGAEACELLLRLAPREIVYVSCDPVTLARDLVILQRDYRIAATNLVDLFPQTAHIETVCFLERKQ